MHLSLRSLLPIFIFAAVLLRTEPAVTQDTEGNIDHWCRTAEDKSDFVRSACADVFRAAAASVAMVNWGTVGQGRPCGDEMQEAMDRLAWFWGVFRTWPIEFMPMMYEDFIKSGFIVPEGLEKMLSDKDERMLAAAMIKYFKYERKESIGIDANQIIPLGVREKDAAHLYESCRHVIQDPQTPESRQGAAYCKATISGIWVGYALVDEALQSYKPVAGACAEQVERSVLSGVRQRLSHDMACPVSRRKSNAEIAAQYVHDVDSLSQDSRISMQKQPAVLGMIQTISHSCRE